MKSESTEQLPKPGVWKEELPAAQLCPTAENRIWRRRERSERPEPVQAGVPRRLPEFRTLFEPNRCLGGLD